MTHAPAFIPSLRPPTLPAHARAPASAPVARHALRARRFSRRARTPVASAAQPVSVQVGEVVAVERGRGRVDLARVTGVSSSGDTVDVELLDEFVRELYVPGKAAPTFERVENVRKVASEFVPSQQGWIVLDQDLTVVKNYFEMRASEGVKEASVVVTEAPKRELDPAALEKQRFPKPTRTQAFFGAAFSVPIAAFSYSAFAGARQVYAANPAGEDLMSGAVFRQLVLFATGAGAVAALGVGCALFLYALSASDE